MSHGFPQGRAEKRSVLLQAVKDVTEAVSTGAEAAEATATLPPAIVASIAGAGLFRLKLPAELGGTEADPVTQLEVIEALTYVYPSAGWCLMTGATAIGQPGAFLPGEGIEKVFAGGRVPLAATVGNLAGTAVPVDGGYRVTGRWQFVSGVRHAEWISAGGQISLPEGEKPQQRRFVFPATSAQIHDNWEVAGLRGTGSCDVSVADLFVPEALSWDTSDTRGEQRRGGLIFRLGLPGFVSNEHAAFALGVGARALDLIVDLAQSKRRGRGAAARTLSEREVFQRFVGQADLRLRAARLMAIEVHEEAWSVLCGGGTPGPRLEAEMRSSAVFATEAALEIATQAFRFGGGSALFATNMLQLCMRDINAGAQHLAVSDVAYENSGKFRIGLPDASEKY